MAENLINPNSNQRLFTPITGRKILSLDDPRVQKMIQRLREVQQPLLATGQLKALDEKDPRVRRLAGENSEDYYETNIRPYNYDYSKSLSSLSNGRHRYLGWEKDWYGTPSKTTQQTPAAAPQSGLIRGYSVNGTNYNFDDDLDYQFDNIRRGTSYFPGQTWQEGKGIDTDFYGLLLDNVSEGHPLYKNISDWTLEDWDMAEDLYKKSPKIRQTMFDKRKNYYSNDPSNQVTPIYKKGGSLQLDYRAWEKEMYDSYKCGGKTKKKSCGGTMRGKKKACGGMKVKK